MYVWVHESIVCVDEKAFMHARRCFNNHKIKENYQKEESNCSCTNRTHTKRWYVCFVERKKAVDGWLRNWAFFVAAGKISVRLKSCNFTNVTRWARSLCDMVWMVNEFCKIKPFVRKFVCPFLFDKNLWKTIWSCSLADSRIVNENRFFSLSYTLVRYYAGQQWKEGREKEKVQNVTIQSSVTMVSIYYNLRCFDKLHH